MQAITTFDREPAATRTALPRLDLAMLTPFERAALMICLSGGGALEKRGGRWFAKHGRAIAGITVANLARDGFFSLTITRIPRTATTAGSARMTVRGEQFAEACLQAHLATLTVGAAEGRP